MGRIVGIALVVAALGVAAVVLVGPGENRAEPGEAEPVTSRVTPARSQGQAGASRGAEGRRADPGRPARVGDSVGMRGLRFTGATARVRPGEAVRFVNRDDVAHDVTEDVGSRSGVSPVFASERIPPGGSFTFVARAVGEIRFVCTLHPTVMSGRIVVARS